MPRRLAIADLEANGLSTLAPSTLTSVEVGFRKPDPRGFAALAALLGCDTGEMLFVGNEEKDVVGARAAGMVPVLLWRSLAAVPAWGQGFVIDELAAVAGLIDEDAV
jgi:putative hydrolase of the HAD superfamily